MTIDTKTLISISEANQNFSKVARLVDEYGSAVILKNNIPKISCHRLQQSRAGNHCIRRGCVKHLKTPDGTKQRSIRGTC